MLNPITVYATKASALLIKHPHAHKMTLTGAIWPKDGFTGRRLRDGSVTMDKAKAYAPPQPAKAVAPSAPGSEPASSASANHAD